MISWFKCLFCKHTFVRINENAPLICVFGIIKEYRCSKCGKVKLINSWEKY